MTLTAERAMDRAYNHKGVEERLYQRWLEAGIFTPEVPAGGRAEVQPFCIVIPPPNVTGALHHGSAMFATLQDVMSRWRRMQGFRTLWLPGTDHAGIATQNVVEAELARQGISRFDLGRDRFVERVWQWKEEYGSRINDQLRRMGSSLDWTRERFTMDPGLSRAVREAFVRLYEKGLIYRGTYIVNWCPRCTTVLSDVEVEHVETDGHLWHVRYPLEGSPGQHVVVATTRPETMLGDTGVAVHPSDARYSHLVGRRVVLPLLERSIPIIGDEAVEMEFGTGAVKVTPAHDPTDYEIGRRSGLPAVDVMNPDATIGPNGGPYAGLDRFEARRRVVADLESRGLIEKISPHRHAVAQCSRCDTVLEPRISDQWFVRMKPLAEPAIEVVRDGRIKIVPERFAKQYLNWMENIRDWVISRQLWWGHRIPVWYCDACGQMIVSREDPNACTACGGVLRQDEDVLDTWFSSALWPFSTLGWPDQTPELAYFYPTSVLETGWDILTFWVSRMIVMGLECMGEVPFETVYLHGMVRHEDGSKISKSDSRPGDDPLDVIDDYGADALRFYLATAASPGNDLRLSLERIEGARNFANKLWNAARFVQSMDRAIGDPPLGLADRWIRSRVEQVTADVNRQLEAFNFGEAGRLLYEFVWDELCDWYIEIAKRMDPRPVATLRYVLDRCLVLLHPFMPFVTEEIWSYFHDDLLAVTSWPTPGERDADAEAHMRRLIEVVSAIRTARSEYGVAAGRKIDAFVAADERGLLLEQARVVCDLAGLGSYRVEPPDVERPGQALHLIAGGVEIYLPLAGLVDLEAEVNRLNSEVDAARAQVERLRTLLSNQGFVAGARPEVVQRERERLQVTEEKIVRLEARLTALRR